MTTSSQANVQIKIFCHSCGKQTNHNVLCKEQLDSSPDEGYRWAESHYFARCAGCDAYTYAIESWGEDDWNPNTGEMDATWKTYPRSATERQTVVDFWDLPPTVNRIYLEVIGAMNAQLPVLAGIGLRALIESVCRERGIAASNLEKLIDGLAISGVLSKAQAEILHTHRFLGNVAAHEVVSAKPKELIAALEIAENVLKTIYVLPELSKQVETGKKPKSTS